MRRSIFFLAFVVALGTTAYGQMRVRFLPSCATCIAINVGDDWQAAATAASAGQTFIVKAGTHRLQSVTPKSNQTFQGETGAIMSGAKVLTGATGSNPWVYGSQLQHGTVDNQSGTACQSGHDPLCAQPEDVFYDGLPLQAVGSTGAGGTGKFYFDYTAHNIYIWDTPVGHTVETSVTPSAFLAGSATGVTIRNLTVQNYATVTGYAAITMGASWVVDGAVVRFNHYAGINSTTDGVVRNSYVHHNGAFAMNGSGSRIVIQNNEIAYNNSGVYAFYNPGQGAGGSKWVYTDNLIVRGNFSHHNYGPGLWTDINNIYPLYEYNIVEDNYDIGIFQEVGYDAIIRYNTVNRNGTGQLFPGDAFGAGIADSSSRNVEIYGNTLTDNWEGIVGLDTGRSGEGENSGPWLLTNFNVHDNTVNQTTDLGTGSGITGVISRNSVGLGTFLSPANNKYTHNTYHFGSYTNYFNWNNGTYPKASWQGFGQDTTGTFTP